MHSNQSNRIAVWNEIVKVLQSNNNQPMDVLQIRRNSSNRIKNELKSVFQSVLYEKEKIGKICKDQSKRGKPLWSLPSYHNQQNNQSLLQNHGHVGYSPHHTLYQNANNQSQRPASKANNYHVDDNVRSMSNNSQQLHINDFNQNDDDRKLEKGIANQSQPIIFNDQSLMQNYAYDNYNPHHVSPSPLPLSAQPHSQLKNVNNYSPNNIRGNSVRGRGHTRSIINCSQQASSNHIHQNGVPFLSSQSYSPHQIIENQQNYHINQLGRGRGRGRGRSRSNINHSQQMHAIESKHYSYDKGHEDANQFPSPSPPKHNAEAHNKAQNEQRGRLNPNAQSFYVPQPSQSVSSHFKNSDDKQHQNKIENIREEKVDAVHISTLISEPFRKENEHYTAYLYRIEVSEDPNKCPFGILLPRQIPDEVLEYIDFPIQIQKDIELEHKKCLDKFMKENLEQVQQKLNKKYEIGKDNKQNSRVTLHLIKTDDDSDAHGIQLNDFHSIEAVNVYWFQKLDQKPHKRKLHESKLGLYEKDGIEKQKRFYLICKLQLNDHYDEYEIDYPSMKRIYNASKGSLRLRKKKLKDKLVEIKKNNGTRLGISYGLNEEQHKMVKQNEKEEKYETLADWNDDKSLISVRSFENKSVASRLNRSKKSKRLNNESPKYHNKDMVAIRIIEHKVYDMLTTHHQQMSGGSIDYAWNYFPFNDLRATGMKSNMWHALNTLPSILWRIEHWLSIIDLGHKLLYDDDQNDDEEEDVDLTLLFQAMHRSKVSSNMSYQIFYHLGAYVLKFICTLFYFSSNLSLDAQDLCEKVREIMTKRSSKECILSQIAEKYQLASFAILNEFDFEKWNPPQFQRRNKNSLYEKNGNYDIFDDDEKQNNSHPVKFEYRLLQSIFGVYWISAMNSETINSIGFAIHQTLEFFKNLELLPRHSYKTMDKLNDVKRQENDQIVKLKKYLFGDSIEMDAILYATLKVALEKSERYFMCGITNERLQVLGNAVLDLLCVWSIYCNIVDQGDNEKDVMLQINDKKDLKAQYKGYMTEARRTFLNNNSLGYKFYKNIYSPLKNVNLCWWFDKDQEHAKEIDEYCDRLSNLENEGESKCYDKGNSYYEQMKNHKSPGGFVEDKDQNKWPLNVTAPKVFGGTFEALVGATFLIANVERYLPSESQLPPWNLKPCIVFLNKFLSADLFDESFWKKWANNQKQKSFV